MTDYPPGPFSGILAYLFLNKLCERLERNNQLPPGERGRIWTEIVADLQHHGRHSSGAALQAIIDLKLTQK
ncbi:MAG TPA: hypothetical protein VFX06_09030 [Stellaceae bacterium]|nr:hypothetical protein [Stellaceae bacterium]